MEGQLGNTNYVVIIVTAAGQETQSCVVVTGGPVFLNVCGAEIKKDVRKVLIQGVFMWFR